ncbi:MAG TPA: HlyD family efflux transporter periplasmic adaptor subunit [Kouleothrix sp.]|uniref:HlyD family secretion protein n=1 Tax=Kouleothrix sp. TaxID=2779161 RepID=UPI002BD3FCE7|nr:HlyD family efflux transporter periplasmic adaptor subunit [Kouleothrix sp.]
MTTGTVPTETPGAGAPPRARARVGRRPLILGIVGLIVLAALARFGYTYYIDSTFYVSTDDALVDSNMVSVAPLASGTLATWRVRPGDKVHSGQVLGQIKPTTSSVFVNITAPLDGTILRVDAKEGQVVAQAQALAYVANLDAMRITAYVDESQIHKIHAGQAVEVTVDATGSSVYQGTVSEVLQATASSFAIIPSSDRTTSNFTKVTQRIEVHISIGSTAGTSLYPGENAYVRIRTA